MNNLVEKAGGAKIKIVCSWCGKDMGEKNGKGVEGVSHGLCQECLVALKAEIGESGTEARDEDPE